MKRIPLSLILALLASATAACGSKKAPAPAAAPQAAAESAAPAKASSGPEGKWEGSSGEDMPLNFSIEGGKVTGIYVNLKAKKDSCSLFSSLGAEDDVPLNGKSFTAHGQHDKFEFTLKGTLISDSEASGTIDWKTNSEVCGPFDTQLKWTAKKGTAPAPDEDNDE